MKRVLSLPFVRFFLEVAQLYFSRRVSRSAAELAYFLILSFFPMLICLNAFIGLLDLDFAPLLSAAATFLPGDTATILKDYLQYVSDNQSPGLLATGVAMSLFSASAAFRALMNIMGDLYGRRSYRGMGQVLASLLFSLLFLAVIYLSIVVLFTGGHLFHLLGRMLPPGAGALFSDWLWLRFFLLFCLVLVFVLVAYRMSSPRGNPRPRLFAGGVLASAALVAASALFSWFIGMSSRYSLVYGSLASIIILLVWLYLCGNILILGNVFNCVWYRRRT